MISALPRRGQGARARPAPGRAVGDRGDAVCRRTRAGSEPGDLFVAVGGGAEFLDDALGRGAAAALVPGRRLRGAGRARRPGARPERRHVSSRSPGRWARRRRRTSSPRSAAPQRRTIAAERSYNAEIGVPLTIGRVERDTELCILELAMRGFGQIAELCAFARPQVGVITNVGPVHLEHVGDLDGVVARQGRADRRPSGGRDGDRAGWLPRRARRPRGRPRRSRRAPRSVRAARAAHLARHRRGRLHCAASGRQRPHRVCDASTRWVCDCRPSSTSRSPPGGTRRSRFRAEACSSTTPGTRIPVSMRAALEHLVAARRTAGARSPCWGTWPSSAPTATRVTARSAARSSSSESTR